MTGNEIDEDALANSMLLTATLTGAYLKAVELAKAAMVCGYDVEICSGDTSYARMTWINCRKRQ